MQKIFGPLFIGLVLALPALPALAQHSSGYYEGDYAIDQETLDDENRIVTIHNNTGTDVHWVYAVNLEHSKNMELLGENDVLSPDEKMDFDVNDWSGQCVFDFTVKFANGARRSGYDINVCQVSHIDIRVNSVVATQ